jgi:hypothetical protein
LTYEEKPARNPQYPNDRVIKDIQLDTRTPGVTEAPVASQRGIQGAGVAPDTIPAGGFPTVSSGDDRQIQIMRQSALERAIKAHAAGIFDYSEDSELYKQTEEFLHYFQTGEYPGKLPANEQAIVDEFAEVFPSAA